MAYVKLWYLYGTGHNWSNWSNNNPDPSHLVASMVTVGKRVIVENRTQGELTGRAWMSADTGTLTINPLYRSDTGMYVCEFSFHHIKQMQLVVFGEYEQLMSDHEIQWIEQVMVHNMRLASCYHDAEGNANHI